MPGMSCVVSVGLKSGAGVYDVGRRGDGIVSVMEPSSTTVVGTASFPYVRCSAGGWA